MNDQDDEAYSRSIIRYDVTLDQAAAYQRAKEQDGEPISLHQAIETTIDNALENLGSEGSMERLDLVQDVEAYASVHVARRAAVFGSDPDAQVRAVSEYLAIGLADVVPDLQLPIFEVFGGWSDFTVSTPFGAVVVRVRVESTDDVADEETSG